MLTTQTTMDHHIGALNKALGAVQVANDDTPPSTDTNSPIITPTDQIQHSRNTSRASTVSSTANQNIPSITTNDRPLSRNDTRSSQASARGKLPDAADPEYSYVYVPSLSSLPTSTTKLDVEGNSMRSDISGRSANSRNNAFLDIGSTTYSGRPRSTNAMSENPPPPNRVASQDRNGRLRDRTRSEEWADRGAAVTVKESTSRNGATSTRVMKKGVKDFQFGRTLGEGSYSTVVAATDRSTLKEYAIKMLDKRHIIKEKKVKYVNIEKNTLNRLGDHPGIVKLYFTFQDETTLYFVLDLAVNGELLGFIKKLGSFSEECTRYYSALVLDALEYMHTKGVIHRDLKPENILLDSSMRIKITDFGTAKLLDLPNRLDSPVATPQDSGDDTSSRANSFVGTAEYVSPELLTDKSACKSSDLWAFGCIVYQLLAGRPPFKAGNEYQTFQKIVNLEYDFPLSFPEKARDLVTKLLVLDPEQRLSIRQIKRHPFFEGQEWGRALWKAKPPRLRPLKPGVVASFGAAPSPIVGLERDGSNRYPNGTGDVIIASVPETPRSYENGNRISAVPGASAYPPFQRDYRSSSELNSINRQSAPHPVVGTQPSQNRHSYHSLPRHSIPRPRSQPRLSIFSPQNIMSETDAKWAKTLNLNGNEKIIKIGKTVVHSYTQGGKTSTPGKFARKLLGRKKERTLILTNEGRAFLVSENHDDNIPDIGDSGKIKGTIPLDKFSIISLEDEPKGRMWSVETGQTKFILEDPDRQAGRWVEAFRQISEDLPEPAGAYLSNIRYSQSMDLQETKQVQQQHQHHHRQHKIRKADGKGGGAGGEITSSAF